MARGITENDVHHAADALVAGGERPTVERIRAHLGTGSPNTVTRWLETWWQGLGARLAAQQQRLAAPDVPEDVAGLAGEWWTLALNHARVAAEQALAADRAALQEAVEALQRDRATFEAEAIALRDQISAAAHARDVAAAQAAELQRLASRLEHQLEETTLHRDAAVARTADAQAAHLALEARIQALQDAAHTERESLAQHVRAVEDRAYTEIDRARQETKELQGQLTAATRQAAATEKSLRERLEQTDRKAVAATRDADAQQARADALEGQLAALRDLPAVLQTALREATAPRKASRSAGKKKARLASKDP